MKGGRDVAAIKQSVGFASAAMKEDGPRNVRWCRIGREELMPNQTVRSFGVSKWGLLFWKDERGQDLVEYSLIMAFIALAGAAAYIGMSRSMRGLWSVANSRLASANQSGS